MLLPCMDWLVARACTNVLLSLDRQTSGPAQPHVLGWFFRRGCDISWWKTWHDREKKRRGCYGLGKNTSIFIVRRDRKLNNQIYVVLSVSVIESISTDRDDFTYPLCSQSQAPSTQASWNGRKFCPIYYIATIHIYFSEKFQTRTQQVNMSVR